MKRFGRDLWGRKWIRGCALALVLSVTIISQVCLANSAEPVRLPNQAAVIPTIGSGNKLFVTLDKVAGDTSISHNGKLSERVELYFDNARLDSPIPRQFSEVGVGPHKIEFTPADTSDVSAAAPCGTSITITPITATGAPMQIAFFQTDFGGEKSYRHLEMQVRNTEAKVKLRFWGNPLDLGTGAQSKVPTTPCKRRLKVSNKEDELSEGGEVNLVISPGSGFRARFSQPDPKEWLEEGFFEPFTFSAEKPSDTDPRVLMAQLVEIAPDGRKESTFSAQSIDSALIRVERLKVAAEHLQVELSGNALVTSSGKSISTVSFFERLNKYPFFAVVLSAFNVFIVAWLWRVGKGLWPISLNAFTYKKHRHTEARLSSRLIDYAKTTFGAECLTSAYKQFKSCEDSDGDQVDAEMWSLFLPWCLFHCKFSASLPTTEKVIETTIADSFQIDHEKDLTPDELAFLSAASESKFSLCEIMEVSDEGRSELCDLLTLRKFKLMEPLINSKSHQSGQIIYCGTIGLAENPFALALGPTVLDAAAKTDVLELRDSILSELGKGKLTERELEKYEARIRTLYLTRMGKKADEQPILSEAKSQVQPI